MAASSGRYLPEGGLLRMHSYNGIEGGTVTKSHTVLAIWPIASESVFLFLDWWLTSLRCFSC